MHSIQNTTINETQGYQISEMKVTLGRQVGVQILTTLFLGGRYMVITTVVTEFQDLFKKNPIF